MVVTVLPLLLPLLLLLWSEQPESLQEVVIVIKPELHPNGSVKMNPNSLVRSSLELNGIAARKAANGAGT